jgi:TolB-like protein/Flp pilus assembly protein TadD
MASLVLNLLGGFEARLDGGPALNLSTKTGQALLAYLALTPAQHHSRDKLASLLWEDRSDQQARTSLRQTLAVLRKAIPPNENPWLHVDGDWISINSNIVEIDVAIFEELAAQATAQSLAQAAALYKGDLLQGFSIRGESFSDWLRGERERLRERALQALHKLLALQSQGLDTEAGIATANRLLLLDPLDEKARRKLMRLYVAHGRRDLALRQYEMLRERLHREMNVSPEPETDALHQEILANRTTSGAPGSARNGSPAAKTVNAVETGPIAAGRPSVAVLPFINQDADPAQAYLSDGITEDIITELSRYHSLLVIARSSSFQFRGAAVELAAVREKLGVRYLVEGSVRKAGKGLRITTQLIDAETEGHVWAERYDRPMDEIFAVQNEVAAAIAATLEGRIAAFGAEFVRKKPTTDWAAYDHFLQGRELMHRFDGLQAEGCFVRAIALDPNYGHAYAWRSLALTLNYTIDGQRNVAMIDEALACARRAVELDDADAWSHQAMGYVSLRRRQFQLAGLHFDRAFHLNPNDVNIAADRANWLMFAGRLDEALKTLDNALQRDPYPPTWAWEVRGGVLYQLKRYDEAINAYLKVGADPYWMPGLLAAAYAQSGQLNNARVEIATLLKRKPDATVKTFRELAIFVDPSLTDHFLDGLRKAGLPE